MTTRERLARTSLWISLAALAFAGCAVDTNADDHGAAVAISDSTPEVDIAAPGAERPNSPDHDGDGVRADRDCDDDDPRVGAELFSQEFSADTSLAATPNLDDPWNVAGGNLSNERGGQQALLGSRDWNNTVTYAKLSAHGLERKCRDCNYGASAADAPDGDGGHALWIPGLYDNIRAHRVRFGFEDGARFEFDKDAGTARLFGTAFVSDLGGSRSGEVGDTWQAEFTFTYRGQGPDGEGPNGPKREQDSIQPPEVTDQWRYFDMTGGTMNRADGAWVTFTQRSSYPLQVGATANGRNANFGASVWFDYEAWFPHGCEHSGPGDINIDLQERDRFRAGILARASADADQDEGFHGYRCAVARNSEIDCHRPGRFVQLATFMDASEDDTDSECDLDSCPENTTFDQLARTDRSDGTDLIGGDDAWLTFWAVGDQLVCEFDGTDGEHVEARAADSSFSGGTTGVSVLNALSDFDYVRVCEAFTAP